MYIRLVFRFKFFALLFFLSVLFFPYLHSNAQMAARFNSSGDYIQIPHDASLAPPQLTVEFWFKINAAGDTTLYNQQVILDKRGNGSPGYILYLTGDHYPLRLDATLNPRDIFFSGVIYPNRWYHLAVTQDTDSVRSYLNGRLRRSDQNNYSANTTTPLRIGEFLGYPDDICSFRGEIDELRIWNYARSLEEIETTMYETMNGNEPGLAGYWDFDSQIGSVVSDRTSNGNDGALHGNTSLVFSDAPCNNDALPAPVGLRAHSNDTKIDLVWKAGDSSVASFALYRAETRYFSPDSTTLIATIEVPDSSYSDTDVATGKNYYYVLRGMNGNGNLGIVGRTTMGRKIIIQKDYLTGVHYFQWYGTPTDEAHHIDGESLRSLLIPEQPPMLGYYSSRDPKVIRQHLEWVREYGIDFISLLWNRNNTFEKVTLNDHILPIIAGSNIKFMVEYGPHNLVQNFNDSLVVIDDVLEEKLVNDFISIAEDYFDHPNYLTVDSSYAVYLYISRLFTGNYVQAFERVRNELHERGYDLYLIGDEMAFGNLNGQHVQYLDAVSPYIVHSQRHDGYPVDKDFFADLSIQATQWEEVTKPVGISIIPNATMGINKRWEDLNVITLPPQSTPGAACTSTLEEFIKAMLPFIDPQLKMIFLTAWNEWHEDTILEPIAEIPATSTDVSASGSLYTEGYFYEGHGFKPLEVIRDLLAPDLTLPTIDHFSFTPADESVYSISVLEALIDGESLEMGDEIGIFDGELCVGAVVVTGNWPLGFWAVMDKSETGNTDGFITGNTMSFQFWDVSSSRKYTTAVNYIMGDGKFGTEPYSQIVLKSDRILLEPDETIQITLDTDVDTIAFAFTGGGGSSVIFTSGQVADNALSFIWTKNAPQELPETASFRNPIYYLDIETTAEDYNATLFFDYTEALLQSNEILEQDLDVRVWEEGNKLWESINLTIDTAENVVAVSTDHLSIWGLVSKNEKLITAVENDTLSAELPVKFTLEQNFPNPFNQTTLIQYSLPNSGNVSLTIYDLFGRTVKTLVNGFHSPGKYQVKWTGEEISSGMYFYELQSNRYSEIKRLILQR